MYQVPTFFVLVTSKWHLCRKKDNGFGRWSDFDDLMIHVECYMKFIVDVGLIIVFLVDMSFDFGWFWLIVDFLVDWFLVDFGMASTTNRLSATESSVEAKVHSNLPVGAILFHHAIRQPKRWIYPPRMPVTSHRISYIFYVWLRVGDRPKLKSSRIPLLLGLCWRFPLS